MLKTGWCLRILGEFESRFFFGYLSGSDVDIKELMEKLLYREQSFGKRYEYFKWAQHRQDEYLVKPQNKGHLPDCAEASTIQLSTVESFLERIVLGFAYAGVPELTFEYKAELGSISIVLVQNTYIFKKFHKFTYLKRFYRQGFCQCKN